MFGSAKLQSFLYSIEMNLAPGCCDVNIINVDNQPLQKDAISCWCLFFDLDI